MLTFALFNMGPFKLERECHDKLDHYDIRVVRTEILIQKEQFMFKKKRSYSRNKVVQHGGLHERGPAPSLR